MSKLSKLIIFLVVSRLLMLFLFPQFRSDIHQFQTFKSFYVDSWIRWDSPHYVYIADHGYQNTGDQANFIVFPPFYPFVTKIVAILLYIDSAVAAIIVANTAFIFAMVVLYKLFEKVSDAKTAIRAIVLLSFFPTSYFFTAGYAESLFILLAASSMLLFLKNKLFFAGLVGGLAYLTRPFGMFILPALLIQNIIKHKRLVFKELFLITLPFVVCILFYLGINYSVFGKPFAFKEILQNHWQKSFVFPWKGINNSYRIATQSGWNDYGIYIGWWEFGASILAWLTLPLVVKKAKPLMSTYYFLGLLTATSTGFILSMPRYLLSLFPFFLVWAMVLKNKYMYSLVLLACIGTLFFLTHLYTRGPWAF